ncbi:MAG: phytanoyl-CoA dioxygenase family protein [Burkholderiales bacterium]|nr:phytanoyl-CoA dioxygenase family protein [Burkholderiales bacterium]
MPALSAFSNISKRPVLAYYYLQKSIRSAALRRAMGALVAACVGRPAQAQAGAGGDAARVARQLEDTGICFLPALDLGEEALAQIRAHLRGRPAIDQYDGTTLVDVDGVLPPNCDRAFYRIDDLLSCGPLMELANAPLVLDSVTALLGARPTIALVQAWWTLGEHHVPGRLHYDDVYHRDVDDFRFVKLFAYLTDTTERSGAHAFVKGSHRSQLLTRRGPITDEEVAANFPAQDIVTIAGKAGTVFLENTWGIHRPLLATEGRRLMFSVLFALTPWVPMNSGHVATLPLPAGFDEHVNRGFFKV